MRCVSLYPRTYKETPPPDSQKFGAVSYSCSRTSSLYCICLSRSFNTEDVSLLEHRSASICNLQFGFVPNACCSGSSLLESGILTMNYPVSYCHSPPLSYNIWQPLACPSLSQIPLRSSEQPRPLRRCRRSWLPSKRCILIGLPFTG